MARWWKCRPIPMQRLIARAEALAQFARRG
jgi:hypothetical protein